MFLSAFFFRESLYVTFALCRHKSVCLSSVYAVRRTQRVELFGNIAAPSNGDMAVCIKIFGKKLEWVLGDRAS